jgi:protein-S-isoprenylcysteine O-methyltransferase Ste14
MPLDELLLRRAIVFASALVYWGGVFIQARRVRRKIGRSPNVKPRGAKEQALWAGWLVVVLIWLGQPWLIADPARFVLLQLASALLHPAGLALGLALVVAGYAGTLWCYAAMGSAWRMGIDARDKAPLVTRGPYQRVRHPIYLFQVVMLAGALLLLPTWLSLGALVLHFVCVWIKAADEEAFLLTLHGDGYQAYLARTGMLWPRLRRRRPASS